VQEAINRLKTSPKAVRRMKVVGGEVMRGEGAREAMRKEWGDSAV